jgi:DNA mismatch repair protein MutS
MDNTTPMLRQYQEIKRQYPGTFLFFRLGDFYEMFYEDAVLGSQILEITLTTRNKDKEIPMCGVPHHAINTYVARLVRKGYRVAICDQQEPATKGTKLVKREVARVITPGTAIDGQLFEGSENCYLAAVTSHNGNMGTALVDVSTGDFLTMEFSGEQAWAQMLQELESFSPREVLYPQSLAPLFKSLAPEVLTTTQTPLEDWQFHYDRNYGDLCHHFGVNNLEGFGLEKRPLAIAAAGATLRYIQDTQKEAASHLTNLRYFEPASFLMLDPATVNNLELIKATDGSTRYTLFNTLNLTGTNMGARLLRQWLLRPSIDLATLNDRLETVAEVRSNTILRDRLRQELQRLQDIERLLGRISLGTKNPRDVVSLKNSLQVIPAIKQHLATGRSPILSQLYQTIDPLTDIAQLIETAVVADPPPLVSDIGVIRPGYHAPLDELRNIRQDAQSYIVQVETRERERTGIVNLKVKYNSVFGYFIEISKSNLKLAPADYERKQTLVNAERFTTPELKEYEAKVLGAEEEIVKLEQQLFDQVRQQIVQQTTRIQQTAQSLALLDVLCNFAALAAEHNYCRPVLHTDDEIVLKAARHPVIEHQTDKFIPNDLYINNSTHRLLIITGPNMGGKSVYLRQIGLITLMAQCGSFVPATEAKIALVDRIFTRVGASDNLARGRSTFMVEMTETANILNTATPRSLILLDEIGRGTATFDGLSLAWAIAEYLYYDAHHAAKTLFATHYHEMTELAKLLPGTRNYQLAIKEQQGKIVFLRKLIEGATNKSYGIEVARLAGLPLTVIDRAREILANLEANELDVTGKPKLARHLPSQGKNWKNQPSLFDLANEQVLYQLRSLDLKALSATEAQQQLQLLQQQLL